MVSGKVEEVQKMFIILQITNMFEKFLNGLKFTKVKMLSYFLVISAFNGTSTEFPRIKSRLR